VDPTGRSLIITVDQPAARGLPRWLALAFAPVLVGQPLVPERVRTMEYGRISPLQIDVNWDGLIATVTVTGELDITTAPSLMERLLKVARTLPERLILDLSGLAFVDVAGARALDDTHTLLQTECPVILREPRPSARKVFGFTGIMEP
jgi:anti-anti-sigma factor